MPPFHSPGDLYTESIECSFLIEEPAASAQARLEIAWSLFERTTKWSGVPRSRWSLLFRSLPVQTDSDLAQEHRGGELLRALLPDLLTSIRNLADDRERAFLLRRFLELKSRCSADSFDDTLETLALLDFDHDQRQAAIKTLCVEMASTWRYEEAYKIAEELEDLYDYEAVQEADASRAAVEGRRDHAFTILSEIETPEVRFRVLLLIAEEQPTDDALETLSRCLELAQTFEDVSIRCHALLNVALVYIHFQRFDEANALLDETVT